ncbi:MAG: tetratricopeptide repeat protein, partial [Thermoplasmataceae archaeon]
MPSNFKPRDNDELADDYNERGISYFNLAKYPEAVKEFTKAIKVIGNEPDYYFNRGLAYYSLKMLEQAVEDYRKS